MNTVSFRKPTKQPLPPLRSSAIPPPVTTQPAPQSVPPRPGPRLQVTSISSTLERNGQNSIIIALLCFYVFFVYSRLPEVIGVYLSRLHLAAILIVILTIATLFTHFTRSLSALPTVFLALFTLWLVICVPSSIWKGGSARLIVFEWSTSCIIFWIVATLPSTIRDCTRLARSFSLGVLVIITIYLT